MGIHSQPSILVRLVHSVPHINVTLDRVNSTFDPRSVVYKEVSKISNTCCYRVKFIVKWSNIDLNTKRTLIESHNMHSLDNAIINHIPQN